MTDQQPAPPPTGEPAPEPAGAAKPQPEGSESARWTATFREITTGPFGVTVLAFVLALVIGGLLIIVTDPDVTAAASYLFAKPADFFGAAWTAVSEAYAAMFRGAVYNYDAPTFARGIRSLTETMTVSTPLIIAALGVAVGFRAGMFNIGAQGQVIMGAAIGGYVGFAWNLPPVLHLLLALLGGILAGGFWAGIAGFLKARTGAHEVIVTIMLNYVALYLVAWFLTTSAFTRPGSNQPKSPGVKDTAQLPLLLGDQFRLNAGFLVAILAAVFVWWLMTRSTWGFRFRAVGSNQQAARTAGMGVASSFVLVMVVSGALAGLAGAVQILGTEKALTGGIAGSIGFDAITVALLGRSKPLGIFFAGLLYAGLNVGGRAMEASTGTSINIVLVIQSLVVLFIAAPPLVRAIFRLPAPNPVVMKGVSA
ncbi:ABC transporter permease [Oerskovia jenensis]|uniref:ABC transporter permease n=3 Tax=Oerskovia TaxID=162491 RepID=A0ABR8UWZ9_9CELL|nr:MULTISPECIES: ABC transporter permease [Oerskovia]MBD7997070.1 ABC transporter permease [Oerskovia gallyi]MBM7480675.1 simple sugar transport system permease protein [Oerskovia jenensis]MBM7498050.1 simple sugar transport system permease protein [Oerskovia paurometabola]